VVIVAGVILGLGAAGMVGLLVLRARRRLEGAARAEPPHPGAVSPFHGVARAARPLPGLRLALERSHEVRQAKVTSHGLGRAGFRSGAQLGAPAGYQVVACGPVCLEVVQPTGS
jgi:hypothetical protein